MRRVFAFSLIVMASALWIVGAMAQTSKRNAEAQKLKNPEASNAESVESGKKLYARHCASCHGPNGKGDGGMALSGGALFWGFYAQGFSGPVDPRVVSWVGGLAGVSMMAFAAYLALRRLGGSDDL